HCRKPVSRWCFAEDDRQNAGVAPLTPNFLPSTSFSVALWGLPPAFRRWIADTTS
ncbi:hypothetical protein HAX54_017906, partial [Datura stramonium]|nr:hypothetical protein [Datura stramonium]